MGRTSGKDGRLKIGIESRCQESGGKKVVRKNENAMVGLHYERSGKSGRRMKNNSER